MAKSRSPVRNSLEFAAVRGLLALLAALPFDAAVRLARVVFRGLDLAVPRLRRAGMRNLQLAFPGAEPDRHRHILDGVFSNLARSLAVFARLPRIHPANVGRWIRYEGREHFDQALQQGRGVLFYTAHLGNWELSAFAHALMAAPMHVVVRPLDNPLLDALATRYRTASGNRIIGKAQFARPILKALAANEAVGILADQNAALGEGAFVPFFGTPACAHTAVARLAARSRTTVIPGFALWEENEQRYVLRFFEPVRMSGDPVADTARLHAVLESVIRRYPDQWLWIHRRWKTRPPGEPPLY